VLDRNKTSRESKLDGDRHMCPQPSSGKKVAGGEECTSASTVSEKPMIPPSSSSCHCVAAITVPQGVPISRYCSRARNVQQLSLTHSHALIHKVYTLCKFLTRRLEGGASHTSAAARNQKVYPVYPARGAQSCTYKRQRKTKFRVKF
jgi:hypothetical protein